MKKSIGKKKLTDWLLGDGLLPASRWFSCTPGNIAADVLSDSIGACPLPLGCEEDATICPFFVSPSTSPSFTFFPLLIRPNTHSSE